MHEAPHRATRDPHRDVAPDPGMLGPPRGLRAGPRRPPRLLAPEVALLWAGVLAALGAAVVVGLCLAFAPPLQRPVFLVMLGTPVLAASGIVYAAVGAIRMMLRSA